MEIEKLKAILGRYPKVNAAYLYGTGAAGKLRPNSDIDVALLIAEPVLDEELNALITRVICDVEAAFHREADVKTLNDLEHLPLTHEILSKGILLLDRDPEVRKAFVVKRNLEYLDFLPHYQMILNAHAERLRRGAAERRFGKGDSDPAKFGKDSESRAAQPG